MTTTEVILTILTTLLGAKEVYRTVRFKWSKNNELEIAKLGNKKDAIKILKAENKALEGRLQIVDMKYNEIKVAFSMIYPFMLKQMKDDPTQKETLERLANIILQD